MTEQTYMQRDYKTRAIAALTAVSIFAALVILLILTGCKKEEIQPPYNPEPPVIYADMVSGGHEISIVNFTSKIPDAVLVTAVGGARNIVVTQATATVVKFKVFYTNGTPATGTNNFYYTIITNE